MKIVTRFFRLCLIALLLACGGCLEIEDTYTLNPDGSGKVTHRMVFNPIEVTFGGVEPGTDEQLMAAVRDELQKSEGIEAWSDLEYRWTEDERILIEVTGYFPDFNAVNFHNGGLDSESMDWKVSVDEAGGLQVEMLAAESDGEEEFFDRSDDEPVTPDNVDERLRKERIELRQARPVFAAMLGNFEQTVRVRLPGTVSEVSGFEQSGDEISLSISGKRFLQAIDELLENEDLHRQWLLAESDQQVEVRMFTGREGPFVARVDAPEAQIDYAAAVERAREAFAATAAELNLIPIERGGEDSPGVFDELERVVLAGVRWVRKDAGAIRGLRGFNHDPGLDLSVIAEFPVPVTEVSEVFLNRAVGASGENLIDAEGFGQISFPQLSDDGRAVEFTVNLREPKGPVERLEELSGVIRLRASMGTVEEDLGFQRLAIGEEGALFGAKLVEADPSWSDEDQISLHLGIDRAAVEEIRFVDEEGEEIEVVQRGSFSMNQRVEFTFEHKEPLPENGRILIRRHTGFREFEVPFQLKNISLVPGTR